MYLDWEEELRMILIAGIKDEVRTVTNCTVEVKKMRVGIWFWSSVIKIIAEIADSCIDRNQKQVSYLV